MAQGGLSHKLWEADMQRVCLLARSSASPGASDDCLIPFRVQQSHVTGTCCVPGKNKAALTQLPSAGGWMTREIQDTGLGHMGPLLTKGTIALKRLRRNQAVRCRDEHRSCLGGATPEFIKEHSQ